jgi:hypothetical protein
MNARQFAWLTCVPLCVILTAMFSLAGCANYSQTNVRPGDAASLLRVGDEVNVTRKDGSTAYLKIEELSGTGISGSSLTNAFGRNISIQYDEMASIMRYTKDGVDSEETAEVLGGILGLALFLSLL